MTGESWRRAGLLVALAALWIGFHLASDGAFLTPRNLTNLAVQTCVVGLMATGMVLAIAARQIDLSVGSVLGATGMVVAVLQAEVWPREAAWSGPVALVAGLGLGAAIGAWQGWWVAYRGVPSFVVTLAGLLVFRGAAFLVTDGRTVAPLAEGFSRIGGGPGGTLPAWAGWAVAAAGCIAFATWRVRRGASRSQWLGGATVCALGLGAVFLFTTPLREGGPVRGVPYPVVILAVVSLAVGMLAHATRFGRWVFAMGGSPTAAERAGIDTRRVTLGLFALLGLLAALAGSVTVARLEAGTSSMGTLAELSVIAAAVIGGASLRGGSGSVIGALLGALLMQSLENGLVLIGASSAARQIAIGLVLILAVWIDGHFRRESV
ncbi:MAG: sugar ABC transporter permease [Deltaproteobacteria bacterium]|nr:sugar ABC transporter permease [Deltaproteobacteria bacterium]MBW2393752.1 sugar ABC transporter permease [Deltaproteobacteria bacterium]